MQQWSGTGRGIGSPSPAGDDGSERPAGADRDSRLGARVLALHRRLASSPADQRSTAAIAQAVTDETLLLVDAADCLIGFLASPAADRLRIVAGSGAWAPTVVGDSLPVDGSFAGRAVRSGRAMESDRLPEQTTAAHLLGASGLRTARIIPFTLGDPLPDGRQSLGGLGVYRHGSQPFSPEDASLLDEWAAIAGADLINSELRALARRDALRSSRAMGIGAQLTATLDTDEVLTRLVRATIDAVDADRTTVLCRVPGGLEVVAAADVEPDLPSTEGRIYRQQPAWEEALRTGEPVVDGVFDVTESDPATRALASALVHNVAVPLMTDQGPLGVLNAVRRREPPFDAGEVDTMLLIARMAAMALHNADLHQNLQAATRHAQSLERLKSQFLRLASHELRGPIAVARGYVSMMAEGSLGAIPEPVSRILPVVAGKLEESNALIDEMLETSRLEDGALEMTLADIDLRDVAREATSVAAPLGGDRVQFDNSTDPLPVRVDRRRIATVLHNLVSNALKYSGGGVCVTVRRSGLESLVDVADTGPGIAPDDQARLFTRFGRIVTPANSHIGGTGLGLYLSREIARVHGGDITVVSDPATGSTFTLHLPLADPAAEPPTGADVQ